MSDGLVSMLSSLVEAWDGSMLLRFSGLSNASALLYHQLEDVSWVGFYLTDQSGENLVLGPFQGKVACGSIPFGRGVCGTAAQEKRTVVVPDVHRFPGHIACDPASQSELVVPLVLDDRVVGVLDIDSETAGRFTGEDAAALAACAGVLVSKLFA
jgi:L-methionine (R)-S-oxide reductase